MPWRTVHALQIFLWEQVGIVNRGMLCYMYLYNAVLLNCCAVVVLLQLRSPCTYRLSIHNDHELINTEYKKLIDFINKQTVTNIESDSFTQTIYLSIDFSLTVKAATLIFISGLGC